MARKLGTQKTPGMRKRKYSSLRPSDVSNSFLSETPMPTVHNIVATSQIVSSIPMLDLNYIHSLLPFSFYDQNKFAAITVRLQEPNCTTLLFSSGKLVVTGCRSWYECVYASLYIANLLQECLPGNVFTLATCDVQNMVAHVEVPVGEGCLDLQRMYTQLAINCTYQRKMFPGLIYRPEASPVVLLCFFSGKIVITGGKTMEDVYTGWCRLWPMLRTFIILNAAERPPLACQPPHRKPKAARHRGFVFLFVPCLAHGRQCHECVPLERHAVACNTRGMSDRLV